MKSFLASVSLLALTLSLAFAYDPSPVQDFCVATTTSTNGVFVNGKFCKDPKLARIEDFVFTGLDTPRPVTSAIGSTLTVVSADNLGGLNTLGFFVVRVDFAVNGQVAPHTHLRASELLYVAQGTILAGFVSSTEDGNRLFTKTLNTGDLIVFPMGLIHFAFNVGRGPAVALTALNSQNPGTNFIANTMFGSNPPINTDFLARAFQLDPRIVMDLQNKF
ncbi:hypothetical protein AALP_AA6G345500 [Arabis alpina]|uniref:Germin-like protein n=1 Tax=Arabis alpina TaxID=50452 RepID=A0A087GTL3_ARAAL|nr:hypothetical protein AALP_AA6G345500 [Arabis alpina]